MLGERIEVDPDVLIRAGRRMGALGIQLGTLSDALGAVFGSGIAAGWDPAGATFGFEYASQAQEFAKALADASNSFEAVGSMVAATGHNYANADAASTIGGPGPVAGVGGEPVETTAADAPNGSSPMLVPPPPKWSVVQPFLMLLPGIGPFANMAMTWPSGNPPLLRLTAAQWRNLAGGLASFDDDVAALKTALSQQKIPEGETIGEALGDLGAQLSSMSGCAATFSTSIDDFAGGVQDTQDAIRRLLSHLSLDGLWDTVTGFLTGDGADILGDLAHDVGEVLENFLDQVKGVVGLLEELTTVIGDAATAFQKWMRPILMESFGDGVGGTLAEGITLFTDVQVGLASGLVDNVAGTVALADPDTWEGMADVALSIAEHPSAVFGVLATTGKEFVAWDEWSGEHPGRAAGETAFNVGSLFLPGGALSKTGTPAKSLRYGSRLFDERRLPRLTDLPGFGHRASGLTDRSGRGPRGIPEIRPSAVPDSVVGALVPDNRTSGPHGAGDPSGPAHPSERQGTLGEHDDGGVGGGDDPPPDPPGRSTGPSDHGSGRVAPPPSAPAPPSPGALDAPHIPHSPSPSEVPSPGHESSTAAEIHDRVASPIDDHGDAPGDRSPATQHPDRDERPAADGPPPRTADGDGHGHEPVAMTSVVTPGAGTAMTTPAFHDPVNRAPGPDAKALQVGSSDGHRAQMPIATGPSAGSSPRVPLDIAAGHQSSGAPSESARQGTEGPGDGQRPTETAGQFAEPAGPVGNPADSRVFGPQELKPVENPGHQSAVENALRTSRGEYLRYADPRTNDYGRLVNDGGPTVDGRSNNCLDCSLSALASFRGDPTVSAPRFPDRLPDGKFDTRTGEANGLRRAADWLGAGMLEFAGEPLAVQFDAVHRYVANLGPGSSALVVNGWHGRDLHTGAFLDNPDGSPLTDGAHATVIVYPVGGGGPVWWDPQHGLTFGGPPSQMIEQSTYLHFTPIEPSQGADHGGVGN